MEISSAAAHLPKQKRSRSQVIADALKTGEPQRFRNGRGKVETVKVKSYPASFGGQGTVNVVQVGKDFFTANIEPGNKRTQTLARLTDYYSQQPRAFRTKTHTINVKNGPNPQDELNKKRLNNPEFVSAATADWGTINFWNGKANVSKGIFDHEAAHNFGRSIDGRQSLPGESQMEMRDTGAAVTPDGWVEAAKADHNNVTPYSAQTRRETHTYGEDFAEFYAKYSQAKNDGPEAVRDLRQDFPERFAFTKYLLAEERRNLQAQEFAAAQQALNPRPGYGA